MPPPAGCGPRRRRRAACFRASAASSSFPRPDVEGFSAGRVEGNSPLAFGGVPATECAGRRSEKRLGPGQNGGSRFATVRVCRMALAAALAQDAVARPEGSKGCPLKDSRHSTFIASHCRLLAKISRNAELSGRRGTTRGNVGGGRQDPEFDEGPPHRAQIILPVRAGRPVASISPCRDGFRYRTSIAILSEWLLNSGAYMHWISAMPLW